MIGRNRLAVLGAGFLALGILTSAGVAAPAGKRVALLMGPTQDKYLGAIAKGFTTTAEKGGMAVTTLSSPFDPALQAQQIDDAVAQKFDMLVVQPISQKAILPPLLRAKAAGIPVVLVVVPLDGDASKDLYLTYAGYDDTALGKIAGDAMVSKLVASGRSKAKVAIIAGSMDEGKAPLRQKAFVGALSAHPGFEVVDTEDVKWNPVTAERSAGQLLARFAGLDGIYGMNDTLANAAIQSASSAGLTLGTGQGEFIVAGGNCQAVGIRNIASGQMAATTLVLPIAEGQLAAEKAADYFSGKTLNKSYFLPSQEIDKANVSQFAQPCSY